jgi:hypothetical protein
MSKLPENVEQEVQKVLDELHSAEIKAKNSYYELANFLYALEHCHKKIREIRDAAIYRKMMKNTPDLPGI